MKNRKESDAKWRNGVRSKAAEAGMSVKAYRAMRWPSTTWAYAVEIIRKRCRKTSVQCTITAKDLAELWDSQGGKCPLTGWSMIMRKSGHGLTPETVTVDRIDQTVGYVSGNVRLISFAANNARYVWDDAALLSFCKAVVACN